MVDENKCPVCHGSGAGIDPVFGHPGKCYPCDGTGKDHRTKEGHDSGHCWICSNWKVFGGNETPMRRDQQLDDMIADNRNLSIKLSAAQTEVKLLRDAIDKSNVALAEAVETKEERDRLLLQVDELRSSLAEMVRGLRGLDCDNRWREEIEDAEKLLAEKRKCKGQEGAPYKMEHCKSGDCSRNDGCKCECPPCLTIENF